MLRVTIELLSAITGRTSKIGEMYIANDGKRSLTDPKLGNYTVAVQNRSKVDAAPPIDLYKNDSDFAQWSKDAIARHPKAARTGSVLEYPRLAYNVWRLVARACLAAFPEECSPTQSKKRKGIEPVLDAQVMRGLAFMRDAYDGFYPFANKDHDDVRVAVAWLDAAKSDTDVVRSSMAEEA